MEVEGVEGGRDGELGGGVGERDGGSLLSGFRGQQRRQRANSAKGEGTNRVLPNPADTVHSSASDPLLALGTERVRDVACGEGRLVVTAEGDVGRSREGGGVEREGSGVGRGEDGSVEGADSSVRSYNRKL